MLRVIFDTKLVAKAGRPKRGECWVGAADIVVGFDGLEGASVAKMEHRGRVGACGVSVDHLRHAMPDQCLLCGRMPSFTIQYCLKDLLR